MNAPRDREKLFVLAADRDIEEAISAILRRPESIEIRPVQFECQRHPNRDNGCRATAADFLRTFRNRFSHALVVFDRNGCGSSEERESIERSVEAELDRNGWPDCGKAVVIDPELEAWVWTESRAMLECLRWKGRYGELKSWLREEGLWSQKLAKPDNPKMALRRTLEHTRRRRSARVYADIAKRVSLARCQDLAFGKLVTTLRKWFPPVAGT